jgi:hypothetical protein
LPDYTYGLVGDSLIKDSKFIVARHAIISQHSAVWGGKDPFAANYCLPISFKAAPAAARTSGS